MAASGVAAANAAKDGSSSYALIQSSIVWGTVSANVSAAMSEEEPGDGAAVEIVPAKVSMGA
jgi:hypothetical protein